MPVNLHHATEQFREAMTQAGLTPPAEIIPDGKIHRFASNGCRDDDAGWYVFHDDGIAAGCFGDWRTGHKQKWSALAPENMSAEERAAHRERVAAMQRAHEDDEKRRQAQAAEEAWAIWDDAAPAEDVHPYLIRKQVRAYGLRVSRGDLLVPMCDVDWDLRSLQQIDGEGNKRFWPGGRVKGCFHLIGEPTDVLCLAEGYATAASIHQATGYAVAVCFSAGNLPSVANVLRGRYPTIRILVCGDHDANGRGQAKATEAAEAVGGFLLLPEHEDVDWNDVAIRDGLETVRTAINAAEKEFLTMGTVTASALNSQHVFAPSSVPRSETSPEQPTSVHYEQWPTLDPEALHGLFGEIVRTLDPHTEADNAAILIQSLAAFGNLLNRAPHFQAEADYHALNLYAVLVGDTSKGRKGSSWGHVRRIFSAVDPDWASERIISGLSSGEGLIWQVRDPISKTEPVKENNRYTGELQTAVIDQGVTDKRLFVLESEFASVLAVMRRDGNNLSALLRQAWDTGDLRTMTKNSPAKATGAHISIVAHVTKDELLRLMETTEAGNGFANRFLWLCSRRSKALPDGGSLHETDLAPLIQDLARAAQFARGVGLIQRDNAARAHWHQVYPTLSAGHPGMLGAVTSRAEAITMRLASLFALGDMSYVVTPVHLTAALAVWEYCEASARYIFGQRLGDPVADELLLALRQAPGGMTRTEIRDFFSRNRKAYEIDRGLKMLAQQGLARWEMDYQTTRPIERWFAVV